MLNAREIERQDYLPYSAGLPLIEDRLLLLNERAELGRTAWRLLALGIGCFIGLPFAGAALGVVLAAISACVHSPASSSAFVVAVIVASLPVFMPATLFAYNGYFQRGLRLFKDLRLGYVREFAGELEAGLETDAMLRKLRAESAPEAQGKREMSVAILPVSHRVWRQDGHACRRWVGASWIDVAMPPSSVATGPTVGPGIHRRALSNYERKELASHVSRLWQTPLISILFFASVLVLAVFAALTAKAKGGPWFPWFNVVHWGWVVLVAGGFLVQRLREVRVLWQDVRQGEVEVHWAAGGDQGTTFEVLPASGRPWTEGGQPATWRRLRMTDEWARKRHDA